jgi:multidrug efflux pump subunit AcrB
MNKLVKFFIDNYKLTVVLSLFVVVFGLLGLKKLRSESYPAVNFAMAVVTTFYDGATPEDIETKITKEIEDEIQTVSGLKDVRSTSQANMSRIFVRIDMDNEDEEEVMIDLEKAVDRVSDLPSDIREDPDFLEIKSDEFPAIELAVVGENKNRSRDIVADLLKDEIEDNKKVLSVRPVGYQEREFSIFLDRQKLDQFHIGVNEVLQKIARRNVNIPGGDLESGKKQDLVRIEGKVQNIEELKNIVIRANFTGQKVLLKDVAKVVDGHKEETIQASINGRDATLLVVQKKGGADTIELVQEVEEILERFRKQYQDQFDFVVYNNEGQKVENRLDILSSNAVSGFILVIVFLLIFLPGRIGVMASFSLPLAVMATLGVMPIFDMNLDAITILALVIALGMLVDNSVVISENFTRLKHQGMTPLRAAQTSVAQLWLPITATAFTTIAAFLPMLVTKGIMGQFIKFIPMIVTAALLISLIESFFLLPMRLALVTKAEDHSHEDDLDSNADHGHQDWFYSFIMKFEGLMEWAIRNRYKMIGIFGAIIFGSLFLMTVANKFILFPAEQTEIYVSRFEVAKGTRVEKTLDYAKDLSRRIEKVLGKEVVANVVARAGRSKTDESDPKGGTGQNLGLILIYATDYAKYNLAHTEVLKKLRTIKPDYIESLTFEELINGPPVGAPINATFRSNKVESIDAMIADITQELSQIKGIFDLKVDDVIGDDEVYVNIDYAKADRLGLTVDDVGKTVRTALSGEIISKVVLDNKEVELMVRFLSPYRDSIEQMKQIKIMDARGNLVPLGTIANFIKRPGTPQIKHFDFKRSKTLTGNVDEALISSVQANQKLREVFQRLNTTYPDVSLVFGGQEESTKESFESLMEALILALIGIFALMVFLFKSYLRPFIIMTTIPLGLVGFSIAFFFHQKPISFMAMIGIIGLAGIIVNSGIVLISFIDQLKEEGKLPLDQILVRASGLRLRAVVVTSATTISGLFPTAYGIGGSDAILVPMTLAMAWGLTSGTILTLVWVPCAYAILEDWDKFLKALIAKLFNRSTEEKQTVAQKTVETNS